MKQYRFPDNKIWKCAFGTFLFALLLLARDTLYTSCIIGFYPAQYLTVGLIGAAGIVFVAVNRHALKRIFLDRRMLAVILSTIVILVPMLVKRDWQLMYFSILLGLYFAIFLTYFVSYQEVAKYYVVMMAVLGAWSVLATYLFRIFVDRGIIAVPKAYNPIGVLFHNFGLSFVSDSFVKNRNFGIFREPGVYQFFILLGLYLNNYTVSWKKAGQMWAVNGVLAVTMLTTFATGGVIEMGLFAVVMFFDKKMYRNKRARWIAAALVLAVLAVLVVSALQKNTLYRELYAMIVTKFSNREDSVTERAEAIFTDIRIFLRRPIFGEKLSAVLHAVNNNTTSTLILYAVFGVVGGTLNVAAWIALVWQKERKVWANLALLVILFMSFNTENLTWDIFFWLFPCMALVERGLPLLDRFSGKAS